MSIRDAIRELGSLVTDPDNGVSRPVAISRSAVTWNPLDGTPNLEQDGLFTTHAVMPGTDAAMLGVVAANVSTAAVIRTGHADQGSWFQPGRGTLLTLLDGPELHPDGPTTAPMAFTIQTVTAIALGGALRLGLGAPHGVTRALGGGTPSD
jgi:hypothetical protein